MRITEGWTRGRDEYLLEIGWRFRSTGILQPFDFAALLAWSSYGENAINNAKLMCKDASFAEASPTIAKSIYKAPSAREKISVLMSKPIDMRIGAATAILAILYPDDFNTFDDKILSLIKTFGSERIPNLTKRYLSDTTWAQYRSYCDRIVAAAPAGLSRREAEIFWWDQCQRNRVQRIADLPRQARFSPSN